MLWLRRNLFVLVGFNNFNFKAIKNFLRKCGEIKEKRIEAADKASDFLELLFINILEVVHVFPGISRSWVGNRYSSELIKRIPILDTACPCVPLTSARVQGFVLTFMLFVIGNHWDLRNNFLQIWGQRTLMVDHLMCIIYFKLLSMYWDLARDTNFPMFSLFNVVQKI